MATNYNSMSGPVISTVMPNPSSLPITVDETTKNLEKILSFPVINTLENGIHIHQDPITGKLYSMTKELHKKIKNKIETEKDKIKSLSIDIPTKNGIKQFSVMDLYKEFMIKLKSSNEIRSQLFLQENLYESEQIRKRNVKRKRESLEINYRDHYADNIDITKTDVIIYRDGSFSVVGGDQTYNNYLTQQRQRDLSDIYMTQDGMVSTTISTPVSTLVSTPSYRNIISSPFDSKKLVNTVRLINNFSRTITNTQINISQMTSDVPISAPRKITRISGLFGK